MTLYDGPENLRNKRNEWFAKANHIRLARKDISKSYVSEGDSTPRPVKLTDPVISGDPATGGMLTQTTAATFSDGTIVATWWKGGVNTTIDATTGIDASASDNNLYDWQVRAAATNDGGTTWALSNVLLGLVAPQTVGSMTNVQRDYGDPDVVIDVAPYFSGDQLVYSVSGVGSITGSTLTLTCDALIAGAVVTVTATNDAGFAQQQFNFLVEATLPAQITDLAGTPGDTEATMTYTVPSSGGEAITSLDYQIGTGSIVNIADFDGSFTITGLTNDIQISVRARVKTSVGDATWSAYVNVTPTAAGYEVIDNIPNIDITLSDNGNGTHNAVITGSDTDYTSHSPVVVQDTDLAAGIPINLVPPIITENPADTYTAKDGLWISPTSDQAVFSGEWYLGGSATGDTDNSHTDTSSAQLEYRETATNVAGSEFVDVEARAPTSQEPKATFTETWSGLSNTADFATVKTDADLAPYVCDVANDSLSYMVADAAAPNGRALRMQQWNAGDFRLRSTPVNTSIAAGFTHIVFTCEFSPDSGNQTMFAPGSFSSSTEGQLCRMDFISSQYMTATAMRVAGAQYDDNAINVTHDTVRVEFGLRSSGGNAYQYAIWRDENDTLISSLSRAHGSEIAADEFRLWCHYNAGYLREFEIKVYDLDAGVNPVGWPE